MKERKVEREREIEIERDFGGDEETFVLSIFFFFEDLFSTLLKKKTSVTLSFSLLPQPISFRIAYEIYLCRGLLYVFVCVEVEEKKKKKVSPLPSLSLVQIFKKKKKLVLSLSLLHHVFSLSSLSSPILPHRAGIDAVPVVPARRHTSVLVLVVVGFSLGGPGAGLAGGKKRR